MALADLLVKVGVDADDLESGFDSAVSSVENNIGKITAAGAAAGAGLEAFARSQQDSNVALERMARVTGQGSDEMRGMASSLQDATFPMGEVVALMETATQRGLRGDDIAEYASFWDMVGDATGLAGPELGKAGVALEAVGIAAGNEGEALNAFGYITDQTTGDVGEFLKFLERTGPELRDMGMDVDDTAALMGVLENELGMTGRTARQEFRKAINESDGTLDGMLDTLGVSGDQFDEHRGKVDESSGSIEANADAFAESRTMMQGLQASVENLMFKYGGLADAAGMLAVPMLALGPITKGLTMTYGLLSGGISRLVPAIGTATTAIGTKVAAMVSWAAATAAQGARALASMAVTAAQFVAHYTRMAVASLASAAKMAASWVIAMGPVGWVIAAVVALVAVIVANWDKIVDATRKAWEWVSGKVGDAWQWVTETTSDAVAAVVGFFTDLRDDAVSLATDLRDRVVGFFTDLRDRAISLASNLVSRYITFITTLRDRAVGLAGNLRDRVVGFFTNLRDRAVELASSLMSRYVNYITDLRDTVVEMVSGLRDRVVEFFGGLKDGAIEQVEALVDRVRGIKDTVLEFFSGAATWLWDAGKNIIKGLIDGIGSMVGKVGDKMNEVTSAVRDRLPFSPAKKGPLSGSGSPDRAGKKIVEMVGDGMGSNLRGLEAQADEAARAAMPNVGTVRVPGATSVAGGANGSDGRVSDDVTHRKLDEAVSLLTAILNDHADPAEVRAKLAAQ